MCLNKPPLGIVHVHLILLEQMYPFSSCVSEAYSFHALCVQIVTSKCKIAIPQSALKTTQCLVGFVQPAPCGSLPFYKHTQAGKSNSQEPSSASLL